MESIGIRELRQNASKIVEAAENGAEYRVTNHGKDTGIVIGKRPPSAPAKMFRRGVTPEQIAAAQIYEQPRPAGYEEALLAMVAEGRDGSGRIGER